MAERLEQKEIEQLTRCIPLNTLKTEALGQLIKKTSIHIQLSGDVLFNQGDTEQLHLYLLDGAVTLSEFDNPIEVIEANSDKSKFPIGHQFPRKYACHVKGRAKYVTFDSRLLNDLLAETQGQESQTENNIVEAESGDWMSQLLQCGVFQKLPATNIQAIMMNMEEVEYSAGDSVIRQGEDGDYFYLIHQGRCVVLQDQGDGLDKEIIQLGPGQSFGEDALLSDTPRNSTVRMLTSGILLRLSKEDFVSRVKDPISQTLTFKELLENQEENNNIWLDIRSKQAFDEGALKGSINIPLNTLRFQASSLSKEHHYGILTDNKNEASTAAYILVDAGLDNHIVENGFDDIDPDLLLSSKAQSQKPIEEEIIAEESIDLSNISDKNILKEKLNQAILTIRKMEQQRKAEYKQVRKSFNQAKTRLVASELDKQKALAIIQKLKAENEPLQQQITEKENDLNELQKKLLQFKAMKSQVHKYQQQNVLMNTKFVTSKEHFESEIQQLKDKIENLQTEIKQNNETLILSEEKVEQQISVIEGLRKKVADYKAKIDNNSSDISAKDTEIEALKQRREELESELATAQKTLDEERNNQRSLQNKNQSSTAEFDKQLQDHIDKQQKLETELNDLQQKFDQQAGDKTALTEAYEKEIALLKQSIDDLEKSESDKYLALQEKLLDSEEKHLAEIEKNNIQLAELKESLISKEADLSNKTQEIEALQQHLAEIEKERNEARDILDKERNNQTKLQTQADDRDQELQKLLEIQKQLEEERNNLREKIDLLHKNKEEIAVSQRDEIAQFEKEIAKLKQTNEVESQKLKEQLNVLEKQKDEEIKQQNEKIENLQQQLETTQTEVNNKSAEIETLQTELKSFNNEYDKNLRLLDDERTNKEELQERQQAKLQAKEAENKQLLEMQVTLEKERDTYR